MTNLPAGDLALLCLAALGAGTVDAIAGGGGLITVPALLAAGLPPRVALGTNKGQAVFGGAAALWGFARAGLVDGRRARISLPSGFVGSLGGAALVLVLDPTILRPLVLTLLCAVAVLLAFRPRIVEASGRPPPRHAMAIAATLAACIGAYDGFFGPGTGTFLILGGVYLLGLPMARASADAKVVNFASNLAAVLLFSSRGTVLWSVAAPMAVAQFVGGALGARLAVRGGDALVRRIVLAVVLGLCAKLARDAWLAM